MSVAKTKSSILDRLNGTNGFVVIEATGPVKTESAEMPIEIALRSILEAQKLVPGKNCEITDFWVSDLGINVEYRVGGFEKVSNVPENVGRLFGQDAGTVRIDG